MRPWSRPAAGALVVTAFLLLLFSFVSSEASAARPVFQISQGVRADLRDKGDVASEFLERLELQRLLRPDGWVIPFGEFRHDLKEGIWSRMEAGVELRAKPFARFCKPFSWITVGSGFQQAWLNPGPDRMEWEGRFLIDLPLPWSIRSRPIGLYALSEYTVDLEEGAGVRNEVEAGIKIPIPISRWNPLLSLGWRHVDPIHEPDVDQFESSLSLSF